MRLPKSLLPLLVAAAVFSTSLAPAQARDVVAAGSVAKRAVHRHRARHRAARAGHRAATPHHRTRKRHPRTPVPPRRKLPPPPAPGAGGPVTPLVPPPPVNIPPGSVLRGVASFSFGWSSGFPQAQNEPQSSYGFLAAHGLKLIRLPFNWGRVQPTLGGPLDSAYLRGLHTEVARIEAAGMVVVLDLHNSCRYPGDKSSAVCGNGISEAQLNDVWIRLSGEFRSDPGVFAYDIMNEPNTMPSPTWEAFSQGVVTALRASGDSKLLWIEGNGWSNTDSFPSDHPRAWITDPANNFVYSAHEYFEYCGCYRSGYDYGAYSGTESTTLSRLKTFTDWLQRFHVRGSIGEVGWPSSRETSTWRQWNALGDQFYAAADAAGLSVTYWSATSAYNEPNVAYDAPVNGYSPFPGISAAETQSQVIEAHPSR